MQPHKVASLGNTATSPALWGDLGDAQQASTAANIARRFFAAHGMVAQNLYEVFRPTGDPHATRIQAGSHLPVRIDSEQILMVWLHARYTGYKERVEEVLRRLVVRHESYDKTRRWQDVSPNPPPVQRQYEGGFFLGMTGTNAVLIESVALACVPSGSGGWLYGMPYEDIFRPAEDAQGHVQVVPPLKVARAYSRDVRQGPWFLGCDVYVSQAELVRSRAESSFKDYQ